MNKRLLELLVCPVCKGPLRTAGSGSTMELVCRPDPVSYTHLDVYKRQVPRS